MGLAHSSLTRTHSNSRDSPWCLDETQGPAHTRVQETEGLVLLGKEAWALPALRVHPTPVPCMLGKPRG